MTDPALERVEPPPGTLRLEDVPRDSEAVYIFDFDGVIASGIEDAIYKIPEQDDEPAMLRALACRFGLRCADMEPQYQRHLLFQELAYEAGLLIKLGPGFEFAKWASQSAIFFIITARSGWTATLRARNFISDNLGKPIELYQVGRTKKAKQVQLICGEFPSRTVYFVEDAGKHLWDAKELKCPNDSQEPECFNLEIVHCDEEINMQFVYELYKEYFHREVRYGSIG